MFGCCLRNRPFQTWNDCVYIQTLSNLEWLCLHCSLTLLLVWCPWPSYKLTVHGHGKGKVTFSPRIRQWIICSVLQSNVNPINVIFFLSMWVAYGSLKWVVFVQLAILCGWNCCIGSYMLTFQLNFVIPPILIGTIDFSHFMPFPLTLTLSGRHKVNTKQNLLALFSCTFLNWSGRNWYGTEAVQVECPVAAFCEM